MMYLVSLRPSSALDITKQAQEALSVADDWYRFAPNTWAVVSKKSSKELASLLWPLVQPNGNVLVMRMDHNDKWGWMETKFWDWLKKYK